MDTPSYLLGLAALYVSVLFAIAWAVDRGAEQRHPSPDPGWSSIVYALSLTVYCSSWTFYGAVGSASERPWSHAPIYLGPILVFVLAWPVVRRLVAVGVTHRVTSIADYLGARFGKRQALSLLVTAVASAAVLPYVALQFRALSQAWQTLTSDSSAAMPDDTDPALLIAVVLAAFTILFGARRLDSRERHPGLMTAIAVQGVVKLLAFACVAAIAIAFLLGADVDAGLSWQRIVAPQLAVDADFLAHTLISAAAVLCLPRQFHALVVEARSGAPTAFARWLLPTYLLLFMLLAVPISLSGDALLRSAAAVDPDRYVQALPAALGPAWVSSLAFLGGVAAGTGMVIVATVSLAIMVTNEVAVPILIRSTSAGTAALLALGSQLRFLRQLTIVLILFAAWVVSHQLHDIAWLSDIGYMSLLAAAQLAPGLLAGLYARGAHGGAVMAGLLAGLGLWFVCLVLPSVLPAEHALLRDGALGIAALRPQCLFGVDVGGALANAALWSLGVNTLLLVALSRVFSPSSADRRQAEVFMGDGSRGDADDDFALSALRAAQVRALLPPFLEASREQQLWRSFEERYEQRLLGADRMPVFAVREIEATLASVIGAASAGRVLRELTRRRQLEFSDLAGLVSDAGRQQTFNRALLESTIESMLQGVAVADAGLCLVAWNSRYEELFAYPERLLYVGMPVARLYRYNAERGIMAVGKRSIAEEVEKRMAWLRTGQPHRFERRLPDGRVIDIHGVPMPGGGFVTTYTDITDYREMVTALEEARAELESRVASGSLSLAQSNVELRRENRLRAEAEARLRDANLSKSRFMSATSHDLLQPINAARLFTAALRGRDRLDDTLVATVDNIDLALGRAEALIAELREVARIDSGRQAPRPAPFAVDALLRELYAEYAPAAARKGLVLRLRTSGLWLFTDRRLVYRVLQNLVGNAIKYSRRGKVLVGVRRRAGAVELQVLDQGPGIPEADRDRIFHEFERLGGGDGDNGLGLGLAIVQRYATLLDLPLRLSSALGRGSLFSIVVPLGKPVREAGAELRAPRMEGRLRGVRVLCLDNDAQIREALTAILAAEGCDVTVVADRHGLRGALADGRPDVVVADYHLDDGDTGIAALQYALRGADRNIPCVIVSADDGRHVREAARDAGYRTLAKPLNPARLTALIFALVGEAGVSAASPARAADPPEE